MPTHNLSVSPRRRPSLAISSCQSFLRCGALREWLLVPRFATSENPFCEETRGDTFSAFALLLAILESVFTSQSPGAIQTPKLREFDVRPHAPESKCVPYCRCEVIRSQTQMLQNIGSSLLDSEREGWNPISVLFGRYGRKLNTNVLGCRERFAIQICSD